MLHGRERELTRIEELVELARHGRGGALLLHGEPGIGKSTLLAAAAAAAAADVTVLRVSGWETSTALPFSALRQLLAPLLDRRAELPPVQAQALGVALALEPPSPQERLAVPLALVALLARAAAGGPLLALVDDLQWLDPASREAIAFAARRVGPLPVALLLAARDEPDHAGLLPGVERLAVAPLDPVSARAVLAGRLPATQEPDAPLSEPVLEAVTRAASGNPLALVELPAGLTAAQRAGRAPLHLPMRLGPLLQRSFAQRIAALDAQARQALTVAAALERGPLRWLLAALAELELPPAALDAAERAGIVVVADATATLRHPLLRTAAYYAAGEDERRAAHRALAATAPDAPRRAWHLAAAVTTPARVAAAPDARAAAAPAPDASAALAAAALEARAVGGHAEAGAAFARAAELAAGAAARGRLELEAAREFAIAGDHDYALALLDAAERGAGEAVCAEVVELRGSIAIGRGDADLAFDVLTGEAERQLAAGHAQVAARLFLQAAVAPFMTGEVEREEPLVRRARVATAITGGEAQVLTELLWGETQIALGEEEAGSATIAAVEDRLDEVDLVANCDLVGMAAQTSMWAGRFARAERILAAMVDACAAASALGRMTYPLSVRAQLAFRRGDFEQAAGAAAEGLRLARETGQETWVAFASAGRVTVLAARGEAVQARALADEGLAIVADERVGGVAVHVHAAAGFAALLDGRYDEAAVQARRAWELEAERRLGHPAAALWAATSIDALVLAGRHDAARETIDWLAARAAATGSRWAAAVVARGELTLSSDAQVDARAAAALAAVDGLEMPLERARTELAIGERLRRAQRRGDAREPLARALAGFERLGAAPLATRSRIGLGAAPAAVGAAAPLTPEERRIVALVADGRTNREIAAALQLGEKTLERRLTALYRKAGVGSRIELAGRASTLLP